MKATVNSKILFYLVVNCMIVTMQFGYAYAENIIQREREIPYIRQNDYAEFGLSACAPSSTAMILRYHFPDSHISAGHVYHSGTQAYGYNGTLKYYRNVGFQNCVVNNVCIDDTALKAINENGRDNFSGNNYSGVEFLSLQNYLTNYWGAQITLVENNRASILDALSSGPILASVNVCGSGGGHYLVVHNIDNNETPDNINDDYIVVNDPEPNCTIYNQTRNGQNKKILLATFINNWIRNGLYKITFENPSETITVSPSHSVNDGYNGSNKYLIFNYENFTDPLDDTDTSAEISYNRLAIEDEDLDDIMYYYGSGKSVIYLDPNGSNVNISSVKWIPNLTQKEMYSVEYIYFDSGNKADINFYLKDNLGNTISQNTVTYSNNNKVNNKTLFSGSLSNGYYVEALNVPKDVNIDTIKFVVTNESQPSLSDGLIAYYPFNGNANDLSGNGNNGTLVGNATFVEGHIGATLYLDGDGDYVDLGTGFDLNNNDSVSVWINSHDLSRRYPAIFAKYETNHYGPYDFDLHYDKINLWVSDGAGGYRSIDSISSIRENEWYHIVFTINGDTLNIYINGVLDTTTTGLPIISNNYDRVTVGRQAYMFSPYSNLEFIGYIDELRIYNRVLTQSEVTELYRQEPSPSEFCWECLPSRGGWRSILQ
jgi:hypothetical protein